MSEPRLLDLLRRLAECHRPVVHRHPDAVVPDVYTVYCPACDVQACESCTHLDVSTTWMEGDPEPGCDLWREYAAYWMVKPGA